MTTTTTTAAAVIEKMVSSITTETLIQESVMLGAVRDFSGMVRPGMDRLDIPLFNELAVQDVSESACLTSEALAPVVSSINLDRHKAIHFELSDRVSVQAKPDLVAEGIRNGARSLAAEIDNYMIGLLDAGVAAGNRFAFLPTTVEDIAEMRKLLSKQNVPMNDRFLIVSPDYEAKLLGEQAFIDASRYGSANPIQVGEIGQIMGFRVLVSNSASIEEGGAIAFSRDALAFGRQLQPKYETDRVVECLKDVHVLSHLYGAVLTDGNRVSVVDADGANA